MNRLQTIIVALSLVVAFACGSVEAEKSALSAEVAIEHPTPAEVQEEQVADTTQVNAVVPNLLISADTTPKIEEKPQIEENKIEENKVEEKRTIPAKHLLWLFIPAVAIAALGFVCKVKISEIKEDTEKETRIAKWLVGSVLALYVVEFIMLAILLLLGVLGACESKFVIVMVTLALLLMLLNAYGAFATNSAILSRYEISFTWKRVLVYVGIALAVEVLFALLIPHIFDIAIADARMFIPNVIILAITLFVLFGVDMYKQNEQSLRVIPVVFILFMIGMLMIGVLAIIALLAIGLWSVIKICLAKDAAKDAAKEVAENAAENVAEEVEPQPAEPVQLSEDAEVEDEKVE